jgi:perosamine synthetase
MKDEKMHIPLSVPSIRGKEWIYIKECLDTEWVSSAGKFVDQFENNFSRFVGSSYSVACVNGTAALQVALRVVGVVNGDEVIVPTLTFIATVNAVAYLGGSPVFMDCDNFYNLDVEKLYDFLKNHTDVKDGSTYNRATGKRIAAVIPVHIFGNAARMPELIGICKEYGIHVVEDATESLGTFYLDEPFANRYTGILGDIGCFSFNGNKIITTGGGGMIVTDNKTSADRARYLTTQAKDDEIYYVHNEVGYNFRLTNIQAAMGVAQLERLSNFIEIKRRNYNRFKEKIAGIEGLRLADVPDYASNNHWMYALQIEQDKYGKSRDELMTFLKAQGIETRPVWNLNHLQAPYRKCQHFQIEKAYKLHEVTLNIPCSVSLEESQVDYVLARLSNG